MELINQIVTSLGISEEQAKGGTGLLLKLAKEKLGDSDFNQISNVIPETSEVIESAPDNGGGGNILGGIASAVGAEKLGNFASLAGGFSKLGLDSDMVGKFLPIVLSFVQSKGGDSVKNILEKVMK